MNILNAVVHMINLNSQELRSGWGPIMRVFNCAINDPIMSEQAFQKLVQVLGMHHAKFLP